MAEREVTGRTITLQVTLCRNCRKVHTTMSQLRVCLGRWGIEGEDFQRITVEVPDPWQEESGGFAPWT